MVKGFVETLLILCLALFGAAWSSLTLVVQWNDQWPVNSEVPGSNPGRTHSCDREGGTP
jgi:hypothetical protein